MTRGSGPNEGYQLAVRVSSVAIIATGLTILGITLARGGGPTSYGILLGLLFTGLGVGRLWVSLRG